MILLWSAMKFIVTSILSSDNNKKKTPGVIVMETQKIMLKIINERES